MITPPFRGFVLTSVLLLAAFGSKPLFADGIQVKVGLNTHLYLPQGWKVLENRQDGPSPSVSSCLDPKGSTLLLTARPDDPHRPVMLSVYRTSFQSQGPEPLDGDRGLQAETEKLLCTLMNLGYSPTAIKTSTSASPNGTRVVSIEITGKNASGDERVFTQAITQGAGPVVRLSISRSKKDSATEQDLNNILASLSVNEILRESRNTNAKTPAAAATDGSATAQASPGATAAPVASVTAKIVSDFSDALIIVEGKESVGSGFVCNVAGKPYVFSNAHVVCSSPGFKLTNIRGNAFTAGNSGIAVGHDVVRMEVQNPPKSFDLMENLDSTVKIGDEVAVLGNIQGAMVVKPVEGKIQGIGPNLIEVDAPFEPGNSGSPIIHKASGKVIGIATYLLKRKVQDQGKNVKVDVRRFGYRLDSVKTWEPINWQVLFTQATTIGKIETVSDDFVRMFQANDDTRFESRTYKSPAMQRAIQSFVGRVKGHGGRFSPGEQKIILGQFLSDLRSVSKNDLTSFDIRSSYDYFRREMEEQVSFRDDVYKDLSYQIEQRGSSWGL